MALATKEQILNSIDFDVKDVDVPRWGTIRLREMTVEDRLALTARNKNGEKLEGMEAVEFLCDIIATSAVNEDGSLMFTMDDVKQLTSKSYKNIMLLADEAMILSGLKAEEGKDVIAEAEKNFVTSPS